MIGTAPASRWAASSRSRLRTPVELLSVISFNYVAVALRRLQTEVSSANRDGPLHAAAARTGVRFEWAAHRGERYEAAG